MFAGRNFRVGTQAGAAIHTPPKGGVVDGPHAEVPLSAAEQEGAREVWALMPDDLRAFVAALVDAGMMDGRRGLARCRVAIFPDALPPSGGVVPFVLSREERADLIAMQARKR